MDRYCIYVGEKYLEGFWEDLVQAKNVADAYSRNLSPSNRKYG